MLTAVASKIHSRLQATRAYWTLHSVYWAAAEWPFDWTHGVDTAGIISPEEITSETGNETAWGYMGTPPGNLKRVLAALNLDFGAYSFVDVGSGKGRAALIASLHGFREVIAIELSARLHATALRNIAAWRTKYPTATPIRAAHEDVLSTAWPKTPLVVYCNNSLKPDAMEAFLQHLAASARAHPRTIRFLYRNPTAKDRVDAHLNFRQLKPRRCPRRMAVYEVVV